MVFPCIKKLNLEHMLHLKINLILSYIYWVLSRNVNALSLRCEILPLHIETGWYTKTALENHLCEYFEEKK